MLKYKIPQIVTLTQISVCSLSAVDGENKKKFA